MPGVRNQGVKPKAEEGGEGYQMAEYIIIIIIIIIINYVRLIVVAYRRHVLIEIQQ